MGFPKGYSGFWTGDIFFAHGKFEVIIEGMKAIISF
jgi:hypothetical protein